MKAIRLHQPAGISGLVYEEAPDPTPMPCEVLVKVAACGITHNELDYPVWTCRAGHPPFGREDAREIFFVQESNRAQLIELARLADQGYLRPQVGAVYPLAQAAQAYGAKAAGGIPGRVVLQP